MSTNADNLAGIQHSSAGTLHSSRAGPNSEDELHVMPSEYRALFPSKDKLFPAHGLSPEIIYDNYLKSEDRKEGVTFRHYFDKLRLKLNTEVVNEWALDTLDAIELQYPAHERENPWADNINVHAVRDRVEKIQQIISAKYPWHEEFELRCLLAGKEDSYECTSDWPPQLADVSLDDLDESEFFGPSYYSEDYDYSNESESVEEEQSFHRSGFDQPEPHSLDFEQYKTEAEEVTEVSKNTATSNEEGVTEVSSSTASSNEGAMSVRQEVA